MPARRIALIVWTVLLGSALALAAVAVAFGPGIWSRRRDAGDFLAWVTLAMATVCLLLSRVLPGRVRATPGATTDGITLARSVLATALNGTMALYASLAWLVGGQAIAVVALGISGVGLLLAMPSEARWQVLMAAAPTPAQDGGATKPQPPVSRKSLALLGTVSGLGVAAMALVGHTFWTEEIARRPASPISRVLLLLTLALMMAGLAVMKLVGASADKRPRRRQMNAILLLLFAGYLRVQALLTA